MKYVIAHFVPVIACLLHHAIWPCPPKGGRFSAACFALICSSACPSLLISATDRLPTLLGVSAQICLMHDAQCTCLTATYLAMPTSLQMVYHATRVCPSLPVLAL